MPPRRPPSDGGDALFRPLQRRPWGSYTNARPRLRNAIQRTIKPQVKGLPGGHKPCQGALSAHHQGPCIPCRWPRRWVAATVAAATWPEPPARSARAASTRVAPVVKTSSTSRQLTPAMLVRHRGRTCIARSRLLARWTWPSPAWSATRRRNLNAGDTISSRGERPTSRTAARVRSSSGASPRRRTAAGEDGTGTTKTGPLPDARTASSCASPASTAATASANNGANTVTRSRRSPSLNATRACLAAASYGLAAQVGGKPVGHGVGPTRLATP
jgi:hypothetical protein